MPTLHNLPPELISHIMIFVVVEPACFPISLGEPRLRLTQVCTAWRNIAFDTPFIWNLRFPASYDSPDALRLANYWWSQCSSSDLLLLINPVPLECAPPRSTRFLENMVLPFTHRLGVIRVNLNCAGITKLLALPPHSFQNLRKISIWLQDADFKPSWKKSETSLEAAPLLHSVCLSFPPKSQFKPRLPWRQLTRLVLVTSTSGSDFLTILSQCVCLEDGTFLEISDLNFEMISQIESLPNQVLQLPKLQNLSIRFGCSSFRYITSRLILPNVIDLQFACWPNRADPTSDFIAFLQPMKDSLQHLELRSGLAGEYNVVSEAILESLPHLRTFIVPLRHIILPSTLERISKGEFLQKVERFHFGVNNIAPVIDMLHTRKTNSFCSIMEIRVQTKSRSFGFLDELEELRSQGIDIDVIG
ncbi:hypothetical protein BDZ94DRAFT_1321814 [Collybia nuda]|uniref:F-box domain-containing protein n=1 Tax=Collybia nuda TaxID=64659 RepID=A0A9P5Y900_9AGAR|nr:hypothetical protein BDZ94DRAFT_1321814 [Collybia nuda]